MLAARLTAAFFAGACVSLLSAPWRVRVSDVVWGDELVRLVNDGRDPWLDDYQVTWVKTQKVKGGTVREEQNPAAEPSNLVRVLYTGTGISSFPFIYSPYPVTVLDMSEDVSRALVLLEYLSDYLVGVDPSVWYDRFAEAEPRRSGITFPPGVSYSRKSVGWTFSEEQKNREEVLWVVCDKYATLSNWSADEVWERFLEFETGVVMASTQILAPSDPSMLLFYDQNEADSDVYANGNMMIGTTHGLLKLFRHVYSYVSSSLNAVTEQEAIHAYVHYYTGVRVKLDDKKLFFDSVGDMNLLYLSDGQIPIPDYYIDICKDFDKMENIDCAPEDILSNPAFHIGCLNTQTRGKLVDCSGGYRVSQSLLISVPSRNREAQIHIKGFDGLNDTPLGFIGNLGAEETLIGVMALQAEVVNRGGY